MVPNVTNTNLVPILVTSQSSGSPAGSPRFSEWFVATVRVYSGADKLGS